MKNRGDILLVDDDPLVLMNFADGLSDHGFNPVTASSLSQAENALRFRRFDWVICDHDLGDGYGFELVRQIQKSEHSTAVIYLSAALPVVLREAEAMEPVKAVLVKPVDPEQILTILDENPVSETENQYPRIVSRDERIMLLDDSNL